MSDGASTMTQPAETASGRGRTAAVQPAGTAEDGSRLLSLMDRTFLTGDPAGGELVLVRHGEQAYPPSGSRDVTLWVDPPLSARGEQQAEAVGRHLSGRPVAAVYASRLLRAHATGQAIASHHGLEVNIDDRLREIEMFRDLPPGALSPADAFGADTMRDAQSRFVRSRRWDAYPASETGPELRARVVPAVESVLNAHPGQVVVVACHGGVINAYLLHVLGIDAQDMFFRPAHASVHRVAYLDDRRIIGSLNEVPHLDPTQSLLSW